MELCECPDCGGRSASSHLCSFVQQEAAHVASQVCQCSECWSLFLRTTDGFAIPSGLRPRVYITESVRMYLS